MRLFLSLLLLMTLLCTVALSDDGITLGFITGNNYIKVDENSKFGWIVGVMDGIMAEDIL